jgi:hypothetical protein
MIQAAAEAAAAAAAAVHTEKTMRPKSMATKKRGGCGDEDGVGRYTARTSSYYLMHNGLLSCCSSLAASAFEEGAYSATVTTMSLTIYQCIHSSILHSICRESNIVTHKDLS